MPLLSGPPQIRHMQQFRRFPFCGFPTAVVTTCGLHVGMACQLLCCRNVRAGIEQIRNEGPPKVVWGKRRHARLDCALFQNVEHSLVGQAANCDSATFVDVAEKRPRITATSNEPVFQGVSRTVGGISKAIFTTASSRSPIGCRVQPLPLRHERGVEVERLSKGGFSGAQPLASPGGPATCSRCRGTVHRWHLRRPP